MDNTVSAFEGDMLNGFGREKAEVELVTGNRLSTGVGFTRAFTGCTGAGASGKGNTLQPFTKHSTTDKINTSK